MAKSRGRILTEFIQQYKPKPFDWSENNCLHLAHEWYVYLRHEGGRCDPPLALPVFDGQQATRRYFLEQQKNMAEMITNFPGLEKIETLHCTVGDIVLYNAMSLGVLATGIFIGPRTMFLGEAGNLVYEIKPVSATWRILS